MADLNNLSDSYIYINQNSGIKCVKMSDDLYQIGGHLCKFKKSFDQSNDFVDDFFTTDTDFGPRNDSIVYYQHLQDKLLKQIPLSNEFGTLKMTDDGVWIEAQLDISRKYAEMVAKKYGISTDDYLNAVNSIVKMAEAGILGWSSGVAGHQVESIKTSHGNWLKMWYLGNDASLTPNPAEFQTIELFNKKLPYKSFIDLQLKNPTVKMVVSSDLKNEKPEESETKAGRMFSSTNMTQLTQMRDQLNSMIESANVNTGNNALTDNAPEAEGFSMNGDVELKMESPDKKKKKESTKCESCEEKLLKYAHIKSRLSGVDLKQIKMELMDRYDVAWLLEDLGRVLWTRLEFIDVDAVSTALKDAADFIVELKNDSMKTAVVKSENEPEETVSGTGNSSVKNQEPEKPFSQIFSEGLNKFVN